jgi:hypothetical protein
MAATAAVVMASGANAAIEITFEGDTTGQPTFNRPLDITVPPTATSVGNHNFIALPFLVDVAGNVQIDASRITIGDADLSLYSPAFDPTQPLLNVLEHDNNDGPGTDAQIIQNLAAGTQFIAVGTSFFGGDAGQLRLGFTSATANTLILTSNLSNALGFGGPITITTGALQIGNGGTTGSIGTGNIRNNGQLILNRSDNFAFSNNIDFVAAPVGTIVKNNTNTVALTGGTIINNLTINGGIIVLNGQITGDVTINPNGALTGNTFISGNLFNFGILSSGNSPGMTIVTANYTGGGTITQEVQFQNALTPVNGVTHDHLFVTGNYLGATTTVNVVDLAAVGAARATAGNGIEIAEFGNAAAGNLRLGNRSFSGGFEYLLTFVPNVTGTRDGFFLQSAAREELSLNAVILSASRNHVRNTYVNAGGDVHEADWGNKARVWIQGMFQTTQAGFNAGVRQNLDDWSVAAGIDHEITPNFRLGLKGSYGNTEGDVFIRQGVATVDGDTWSILGTAHYTHGGFYADLAAGYATTDWDVRRVLNPGGLAGTFGVASNVDVDGVVGSFDAGYRIKTDDIFTLTFAGQVFYNDMDCGTNCLIVVPGVQTTEDTSDWVGRLEAKLEAAYSGGKYRPWVAVNYTDTLDGDGQTVRMGNAIVTSETANNLLGVDLGLQAQLAANLDLTLQAGMQQGLVDDVQTYQGQVGLKYRW